MWLPALNISILEPHSDVNHSLVESTKDTVCLESQPLDVRDQETLGPAGLALLQVSPLTAAAACSVNNTRMGDGKKGPGDCLLLSKHPSVPPVEKHWSQLATAKPTLISACSEPQRLYLPPVGHLADWFFGKPFLILK